MCIRDSGQALSESINTSIGFRDLEWSFNHGLSVNGERIKIRGFCHHKCVHSFAEPVIGLERLPPGSA